MNNTHKIIAGFLAGSALTFGATAVSPDATAQDVQDAKSDKDAITKQYIDAQVRLNEVPTLDLSVLSADEMSTAYKELATEKDAFTKDNLFEALHDKAVEEGRACK